MRCAHRMPIPDALCLVLRTWPTANPLGHLARGTSSSCARREATPGQRPGSFGFGHRRHAASASPPYICAGLQPACGACRAALFSTVLSVVRSFFPEFWLFLQKCCRAPPRLLRVSIKVAALHYVSCLARLLQTLPAHSRRPPSSHPPGQELSKTRLTKKLNAAENKNFVGPKSSKSG